MHNLTMAGDAEVQFGKTAGQHSGFALADFAPIFLYRTSDNILFEAGFDTMLQNAGGPPGTGGGANTSFSRFRAAPPRAALPADIAAAVIPAVVMRAPIVRRRRRAGAALRRAGDVLRRTGIGFYFLD